jgi:hypothetical protein
MSQKQGERSAKPVGRDAATKVARQRLSVLDLAARLGNAAEACRRCGMDRTSFYEWRRRFQTHGLDGLKDLPPIHRSHPQTTPAEVVERIVALALEHPAYGCNRIEALLMLEGRPVSAITIQKLLNERELGTRAQRWLALERQNAEAAIALSAEQVAFTPWRRATRLTEAPGSRLSLTIRIFSAALQRRRRCTEGDDLHLLGSVSHTHGHTPNPHGSWRPCLVKSGAASMRRWASSRLWDVMLEAFAHGARDADFLQMINSTSIPAHHCTAGGRGDSSPGSRGSHHVSARGGAGRSGRTCSHQRNGGRPGDRAAAA